MPPALEQMTDAELTADLPGWEGDSAQPPLPVAFSEPSETPPPAAPRRGRRSRVSTPEPDPGPAAAPAGPGPLLGLVDPEDPKLQSGLGKIAGALFGGAGELLHRARTPDRVGNIDTTNNVWRPTADERADFSSPAGQLLAKHLPIAWLVRIAPYVDLLGDGSELGGVLTGYVSRNRTAETALRAMIVEEIARQNGERQPEGGPAANA